MQTSIFIAKLIGPILVVIGLTVLFKLEVLRDVARDVMAGSGLLFVAGILALLAGLVLVNTHNRWVWDWPVIITAFGWISILGGIVRIAFPGFARDFGGRMLAREGMLRVMGGAQLLLGAFLCWKGYF